MNTVLPAITTGARHPGDTVRVASLGTWTNNPTSFAIQWQACDAAGNACVAILGATDSTYNLSTSDLGSTFRVAVTASNLVGASAPAASTQSDLVRHEIAYVQDHAFTSLPNPGQTTSPITLANPTRAGSLLVASIETSITGLAITFSCN